MIGTRLADRYEVTAEIGRGGMGVVYRARDPRLTRDVAIKLIPPSQLSPESEQRFQREAQLVAQMDHPAIVPIHDFGRHEDALFFVMPLVQGTNLRAFLRQGSHLGDVVDIGIQVAEGLEYSHARGVVHRDIKPENIMVTREEGAGLRVRVMDFGLARAASESRLTRTGTLLGTLFYLSPEQILSGTIDGRSDLYALGTVLYECVVGDTPYSGEAQAVLYRIAHEFPQAPRARGADVDEELERVIMACLAKEPARRPQRAGDVVEALKRYRGRLRDSDRARSVADLTRSIQAQRPALAPFIGRAREFAELQQRLNTAVAGESQFVVLAGDPGVGKTRLLDELENLARARQIRVLHGQSIEQDRAFPYQGFCDVIQESFRLRDQSHASPVDFSDLAPDLVALFPMLREIREIGSAASGDSALARSGSAAPEGRTQVFELLARTLTRLAGGRPLIVFLEDLHQAEVSTEAIPYIVRRLGPTPILIVGTYRSSEVHARHPVTRMVESFRGDRRFASIALGPLTASDHRSLVETLLGPGISDSLALRLYEGSEGNPFFTKELVRSLSDAGSITRDASGVWTLSADGGRQADALPATIQQAVEKRIERLPEDLRDVLSTASVMGRSFDARDLEALAAGQDVDQAIERLLREGLVEEDRQSRGDVLHFSSGVVRDVLYGQLSRRRRRSLHRQYAELLDSRHADRLDRVLPQLVHHYSQGDVPEKTIDYALQLARASLGAFSADEAARAARTALEFLDSEWRGDRALEGDARMLLASALRMAGDVEGALREAALAAQVLQRERQESRAVDALALAAETAWQARKPDETQTWVDRGLAAARAAGRTDALARILALAATLANLKGDYAGANRHLEELARIAPDAKPAASEDEVVPQGGTLTVALASLIRTIEPVGFDTAEELEIAANVFETLLTTDARGVLSPAICERWETAEGGRRFVLTLRSGVTFSDGAPVTAAAVKQSFETSIRLASAEMPPAYAALEGSVECRAGSATDVTGIVVRSDETLEIRLREPLPIYPALLTDGRTGLVRPLDAPAPGGGRLVGTGPFVLAALDASRVVLEPNRTYWKGTRPLLDRVEFQTALSATDIAKGFRSGKLDLVSDLLPEDLEEVLRDPRLRQGLVEQPKRNTYFVVFNVQGGPATRRAGVRQALAGVIRPSDLVWRTLGRFAQPAVCLIPPGMLGHDAGRRSRPAAIEEARAALEAAGVGPGLRLKAAVHPLLQDRYAALLTSLFALWAELGVAVDVVSGDMTSFLKAWEQGEGLDMLVGRWNADYDDPDNFTHTLFHSRTGVLRTYFASADADRALEDARAEVRPGARETLYRRFEDLLAESAALVPLFHDIDYRLTSPAVRGLRLRGAAPSVNYAAIGKAEAAATAEPRRAGGGTIRIPIAGVPPSLDPALASTAEQVEVITGIFETLTRDVGGARFVPWLASDMRVEANGQRYRFRLRDDVTFHDGRRLGARDVRYSFERLLQSPTSEGRWFYSSIVGARTLLDGKGGTLSGFTIQSATDFTIDLDEPLVYFPALIGCAIASIVPEGSDPASGAPDATIGSGPFRVVSHEPGRRLELERHRGYWRRGYPRADGLVFDFGVSPQDTLEGFQAGRYALAWDLFPADAEALRREPEFAPGYRDTPRLVTYVAAFNRHRGVVADRRLRQRLARAVDVPRLVRQTLGRVAIPAHSLIPPGLLGHEPAPASRPEVIAPGVGASATPVELAAAIHPAFLTGYSALARELTSAFEATGVRIRVVNRTMAEYMAARAEGVDILIGRWVADYPDPDTFAYTLHSDGWLGSLCASPDIDRLIERGRAESRPAERHGIYRQIEEIVEREALLLPLFHEQAYAFGRPELDGLSVNFMAPTVAYDRLRLRG